MKEKFSTHAKRTLKPCECEWKEYHVIQSNIPTIHYMKQMRKIMPTQKILHSFEPTQLNNKQTNTLEETYILSKRPNLLDSERVNIYSYN